MFAVVRSGQFGAGFVRDLRIVFVDLGLVGALVGSSVDFLDGATNLAGEGVELCLLCVVGAEELDRGEVFVQTLEYVALDCDGESELEEMERLDQEVVGGGSGDLRPVARETLSLSAIWACEFPRWLR